MGSAPQTTKPFRALVVLDERLSRDRLQSVLSKLNGLRHECEVVTLRGDLADEKIVEELEKSDFHLVLAPWYRYFDWKRVEAVYGLSRQGGTIVAGYIGEPVRMNELPHERPDRSRMLIFDFVNLGSNEIRRLAHTLLTEKHRVGLRQLLDPGSIIYTDHWNTRQGFGEKTDVILGLPELTSLDWVGRSTEIQIALMSFHNLIFSEHGPGKGNLTEAITGTRTKAFFQMGCDGGCLALRLAFRSVGWKTKDTIQSFWPSEAQVVRAVPLLSRYTDLLRIHVIAETNMIDVVAAFFRSAPSIKQPGELHNIWIEPVADASVIDRPEEMPSPKVPELRLIPIAGSRRAAVVEDDLGNSASAGRDRLLVKASSQIQDLKQAIVDRDDQIRELKSGGVGTPFKPPVPDSDTFFQGFEELFLKTRHMIRQLEMELRVLEERKATEGEIRGLRERLLPLVDQENRWLRQMQAMLDLAHGTHLKNSRAAS